MIWVWYWKISHKNVKFFNFFPFESGQRRVGLLFTADQIKSKLWSGQGPSLVFFSSCFSLPSIKRSDTFIGPSLKLSFVYKPPVFYQQTIQYWFVSWLGRSSLGYLLNSSTLAISVFGSTPPDALYSPQYRLLVWIPRGNHLYKSHCRYILCLRS